MIQPLTSAHAAKVRLPDLSRKVFHAESGGNLTACCVNRAKPSSEDIENAIGSSISEGSVFQCDGAAAYNHLIAEKKCIQIILNSHADYNKVYHLNTVNGLHSRLKEIFKRFRGVSSKYLNRYLAMFVAMEQLSERSSAVERIRLALTRTDTREQPIKFSTFYASIHMQPTM